MAIDEALSSEDDEGLVGKEIPRTDGRKYVTGSAEYAADIDHSRQLYLAFRRSTHAHARIEAIDSSAIEAMDGVEAVITGADIEGHTQAKGIHGEEYGLAVDKVRYYGEPVAAVAAESKYLAEDAANLIEVEYEPLDPVLDPAEAMTENAPLVHPELQDEEDVDGNASQSFEQRIGDVKKGFEEADHIVERTYRFPAMNGAPMEPHACTADYDSSTNSVTFHTTTQVIHTHKNILAQVFDLPNTNVRVINQEVGGAFGNKTNVLPHEICSIVLSRLTDRPVKATLSRQEHLETSKKSFDYVMDVKVGFRDDGTITAWEEEILHGEGAYHEAGLMIVGGAGANTRLLGYKVPNIHLSGKVVYTNRTPGAVVRGTSVRQLAFARESILSEFAREHDIDPVTIRTQQAVSNDECPYETPTGNIIPNTGLNAAIERAKELVNYEELVESVAEEEYTGVGLAVGYHVSSCRPRGLDADLATVGIRLDEDGSAIVRTEACDMGTSCRTTLTQVTSGAFGLRTDRVRIIDNDTLTTPPGDGSHSSRTMTMMGSATHLAAEKVRENLARIAGDQLEAAPEDIEFTNEKAYIRGTDRSIDIAELTEIAYTRRGELPAGMNASSLTAEVTFDSQDEDLETQTEMADEEGLGNISIDYPCSCQIVVASVDPDTGEVAVDEHVIVDDVGKAVNPNVVEGQLHGGGVQSYGVVFGERLTYDGETGAPLNTNFTDYGIPLASEPPLIEGDYVEVPSVNTPGGWKGCAEGPFIVGPPAIANAVCNAIGVSMTELPLTPERVKAAIDTGSEPKLDPSIK